MSGSHAAIAGPASSAGTGGRRATRAPRSTSVARSVRASSRTTRRGRRSLLPVGASLLVLVALALAAVAGAASSGARWFDVRTPSMGTAAPVGSIVVTRPVAIERLRVGDVVSFTPPSGGGATHTHRVVAHPTPASVRTRGDVNGADDPWTLHQADLVGRADVIVPGVGWALRALPFLAGGVLAVWAGTTSFRRADHRAAARVLGVSLVVAITSAVLRPFVAGTLVETTTNTDRPVAVVVSTGILPARVAVDGGPAVHLLSGEVGRIPLPPGGGLTQHLTIGIDLPPGGWAVCLLVSALPLLWCLVVGLPRPSLVPDHGATT
ncbi:S26 family signal peptidase [Curtobacterium sp. RRHDQ10]|uniref:S26 family signal peptidase n=1 Tax=Curtobacterium phyllosphaerae TaxID=3413379 RepID=UPI003BF06E47